MGRAGIIVLPDELLGQLHLAESSNSFDNWSKLFDYVAASQWGQSRTTTIGTTKALTSATIYQRVMDFGLADKLKTPKGKKGRQKGEVVQRSIEQKTPNLSLGKLLRQKADKWYFNGTWGDDPKVATIKKKRYIRYIERLEGGSCKSAIALKCLDCCGGSFAEVRRCDITDCELYSLSPLTKKT